MSRNLKPIQAADIVIEQFLTRTHNRITLKDQKGREAARQLLALLVEADANLRRRLDREIAIFGGDEVRFTGASMLSYRTQIKVVIEQLQSRLAGLTSRQALATARDSLDSTLNLLTKLEKRFTDIARPIRIDESAFVLTKPSLLARHATSVDRYGTSMIRVFERELAHGFISGLSQRDMVNRLVELKGPTGRVSLRATQVQPGLVVRLLEEDIPEGLFVRYRYWAWRIVRTEVAFAQNAVAMAGLYQARQTFPDIKKKIIATFDKRTAADSIAVHGQVRDLDQPFMDGVGRVYQHPPARPHDREVVIPWRERWSETLHTKPAPSNNTELLENV